MDRRRTEQGLQTAEPRPEPKPDGRDGQNYPSISLDDINPRSIRDITYYIGRKALADKYGITIAKAGHIIGLLDLVIHETDDGRIEIVPNNVHRFKQLYAHKGYVSKMLKLINGKEVADEDE